MQVSQAKEFLVRAVAEQASREGVPLSDLEKRMMYFTEGADAVENASRLNEEFEAQYNSDEYEAKVSKLLNHAYLRLKKEDPKSAREWDDGIRLLRTGDHYLLVLWDQRYSTERPPYDALKLLGTAILVVVVGSALILGFTVLSKRYGIHWPNGPKIQRSIPERVQRPVQWAILILGGGAYIYYALLPWILGRKLPGIAKLILWSLSRRTNSRSEK